MDKSTNISPALHSNYAADISNPLQEINGLQMRPNKENKYQDENTGTPNVHNAATNTAGALSYCVPKNNGCSTSNANLLECSAENEADVASNLPLTTKIEKPISLELQPALPAHGSAQLKYSEYNMITTCTPVTTPVQDTTSHVTSNNPYQQSWYNDGSGQILSHDLPSQLKTERTNIVAFDMELSADMYRYQHWNASSHGCPHTISPSVLLVTLINPIQESCDQSDTSNAYQTGIVFNEERFVILPSIWT